MKAMVAPVRPEEVQQGEYTLPASLIAAIAVSVTFRGSQLSAAYNLVASKVKLS